MKPVRFFLGNRVGGTDVVVEELGYFVDDIIEQIKSVTANPHNLNADDTLKLLQEHPRIFFRSFYKEESEYEKWMVDPFFEDYSTSPFT